MNDSIKVTAKVIIPITVELDIYAKDLELDNISDLNINDPDFQYISRSKIKREAIDAARSLCLQNNDMVISECNIDTLEE